MALKPIALDFCDNKFTMGDIRAVYESFWKLTHNIDSIELGNFQNKILKQVTKTVILLLILCQINQKIKGSRRKRSSCIVVYKKSNCRVSFTHNASDPKKILKHIFTKLL